METPFRTQALRAIMVRRKLTEDELVEWLFSGRPVDQEFQNTFAEYVADCRACNTHVHDALLHFCVLY